MAREPATSYDEVPYGDHFFPYTHPDALATVARIYGVAAPRVETARVLELGCARGGNLIPMALELPRARFVGVDLSEGQVAHGRGVIGALGLDNIRLEAIGIDDLDLDLDASAGSFDYIICHGVYSWVPPATRAKILAILSNGLAGAGVAYLSYNTQPGWHARGMVRELFGFHLRGGGPPADRARQARRFLAGLVEVLPEPEAAYAQILRAEAAFLDGVDDSYLFHEHLEAFNQPFYFREVMADAMAAGLQFVGEARTPGLIADLPPRARAAVETWAEEDEIAAEQYLDFLINRRFRRTLLCRAGIPRRREPSTDLLGPFSVSTNVAPVADDADPTTDEPLAFRKREGEAGLTTNDPAVKTALVELDRARGAVGFEDLVEAVHRRLGEAEDLEGTLRRSLLRFALSDLVELHVQPPPPAAAIVSGRPVASPHARLQAAGRGRITTLMRRTVEVDDLERAVLRLLDGAHDLGSIRRALEGLAATGTIPLDQAGRPIEPCLARLAALGLLQA